MRGVVKDIGRANVLTFDVGMEGVKTIENESTSSSVIPKKGASYMDGS